MSHEASSLNLQNPYPLLTPFWSFTSFKFSTSPNSCKSGSNSASEISEAIPPTIVNKI